MQDDLPRRTFLKSSAGAAAISAPGILRAQNSNSVVHVGCFGAGNRGYYFLERLYNGTTSLARVTAVSTPRSAISRAVKIASRPWAVTRQDLRRLPAVAPGPLDRRRRHCHSGTFALSDVYGRSPSRQEDLHRNPLVHNIEQGEEMLQAAEMSDKVIKVVATRFTSKPGRWWTRA